MIAQCIDSEGNILTCEGDLTPISGDLMGEGKFGRTVIRF
jgi:hypothetical protein